MIVRDKKSWLRMVFAIHGSSLRETVPRITFVTLFAVLATWAKISLQLTEYTLTTTPFSLIGVALAIFLGFRNNESYDRFWEGRTLWGRMVNVSRSFARQVRTLIVAPRSENESEVVAIRARLVRAAIGYVYAFKHHLRDSDPTPELTQYLREEDHAAARQHNNVPIGVLQCIGDEIHGAWQSGMIHEQHVRILEESLTEMTAVQGGCERIKSTPIPYTYNVLIHRIVGIYCLALPFGLIDSVGVLTPVVVLLISYAFFGLDAIGDEIEQPFELDDNDLPLDAICRNIEINLLQSIGATNVPEPIRPVNDVLL